MTGKLTRSCQVDYRVNVGSFNGTIGYIAWGSVIFESECLTLATLYDTASNDELW